MGYEWKTIGRTITEADLVDFIGCTGMVEVRFTDFEYAKAHTPRRGRAVPAPLAYAFSDSARR